MKRILIIDDDEGIREAIQAILESEGFEVELADNEKMLLQDHHLQPDLILLDLLLSGRDGTMIAKELKKNNLTKTIPIVMLSAYPTASASAKAAGADDFLSKPFEMEDLLKMVNKYI